MKDNSNGRADAALLLTCLGPSHTWATLRSIIGTWDMLNAGVPTRDALDRAATLLVSSGLAEVRDSTKIRPTTLGRNTYRSVKPRGLGMRAIPGALDLELNDASAGATSVELDAAAYEAALLSYLSPRSHAKPGSGSDR